MAFKQAIQRYHHKIFDGGLRPCSSPHCENSLPLSSVTKASKRVSVWMLPSKFSNSVSNSDWKSDRYPINVWIMRKGIFVKIKARLLSELWTLLSVWEFVKSEWQISATFAHRRWLNSSSLKMLVLRSRFLRSILSLLWTSLVFQIEQQTLKANYCTPTKKSFCVFSVSMNWAHVTATDVYLHGTHFDWAELQYKRVSFLTR